MGHRVVSIKVLRQCTSLLSHRLKNHARKELPPFRNIEIKAQQYLTWGSYEY